MKGNLKILIFLFSIILNVVFVGTYATYKFQIITIERKDDNLMKPLFLELDLTPEQLTRFKSERDKFHPHLQALEQEIKRKQIELIEILSIDTPDQRAIENKQKEIQELQALAQDRVIVHLLQASALISPEQRTRFFHLIRKRIEVSISSCPPWTKPLEESRTGESG
ncbi:MAG: Spy/CpxP family protein refolding chaperone [Deltaproteobacteria bacterium]|nr:Spy/CpxP family protein refolding chaperone [Deltaproteobacteria bacterium]